MPVVEPPEGLPGLGADADRAKQLDVDALFAAIDLDAGGPARPLRDAGSGVRRGVVLGVAALAGATSIVAQLGRARSWDALLLAEAALIALLATAGLGAALRPMALPPLAHPWRPGVALAALTAVLVVGGVLPGLPVTPHPAWSTHWACGTHTTAVAMAVGLVAGAAERGQVRADWRWFALAAASGLVAFASQMLVCPVVDPVHLALAHASAGLPVAAFWWVARPRRA